MPHAVYMSEADAWWTLERQREVLANSLAGARIYIDELDPRDRQGHSVAALRQRKVMLRTTTRQGPLNIIVAAWPVLAWEEDDMREVLRAVKARDGTIICLEDGALFGIGLSEDEAIRLWRAAKTKSRKEGGQKRGGMVTKERQEAATAPKVQKHAHLWGHPGYTAPEVLALMGVSRNTANKYTGMTWEQALRKNRERFQRQARKAAKEAISDE